MQRQTAFLVSARQLLCTQATWLMAFLLGQRIQTATFSLSRQYLTGWKKSSLKDSTVRLRNRVGRSTALCSKALVRLASARCTPVFYATHPAGFKRQPATPGFLIKVNAVSQGLNRDSLKTLRHSRFAGFQPSLPTLWTSRNSSNTTSISGLNS